MEECLELVDEAQHVFLDDLVEYEVPLQVLLLEDERQREPRGTVSVGCREDEGQHDVADAREDVELGLHVRVQGQVVVWSGIC
jgi:hypothetical protein